MKVARTSPSCEMSFSVSAPAARRTPRPAKAIAVESSFSVPARPQATTIATNVAATTFSPEAREPSFLQRLARLGRRGGGRLHLGREDLVEEERQAGEAEERRDGGGDEPRPEADLEAVDAAHLRAERVRGHRREPERRGDGQARHPAEHEVRAHPLPGRLVGLRAAAAGEGVDDGVEDAAPGRVAREGGGDDGVEEEDAVAEAERRLAEEADDDVPEPLAEAALHDGPRDEEGDDDEEDRPVREPGVGAGGRERPGEDGGADREDGRREDREDARDDGDDRPEEEGEEVPRRGRQPLGDGCEPEAEDEGDRRGGRRAIGGGPAPALTEAPPPGWAGARRTRRYRPFEPVGDPLDLAVRRPHEVAPAEREVAGDLRRTPRCLRGSSPRISAPAAVACSRESCRRPGRRGRPSGRASRRRTSRAVASRRAPRLGSPSGGPPPATTVKAPERCVVTASRSPASEGPPLAGGRPGRLEGDPARPPRSEPTAGPRPPGSASSVATSAGRSRARRAAPEGGIVVIVVLLASRRRGPTRPSPPSSPPGRGPARSPPRRGSSSRGSARGFPCRSSSLRPRARSPCRSRSRG